jgi:hypothetical protein
LKLNSGKIKSYFVIQTRDVGSSPAVPSIKSFHKGM